MIRARPALLGIGSLITAAVAPAAVFAQTQPMQRVQTGPLASPEQPQPGARGTGLPSLPGAQGAATGMQAFVGSRSMLQVPVTSLFPGNVPRRPDITNPADDYASLQRGMQYFNSFNCVGCHAANGGGGMGPALSNWRYIYGDHPANIFLTIKQGRPNGMPAWGAMLPDEVIWDLVTYVRHLRAPEPTTFGRTVSRTPPSPDTEQVPAEYNRGPDPWKQTETMSPGRKPNAH